MSFTGDSYQPEIHTDLASLTPLHDFVLVREFEPPATQKSVILDPGMHMTGDYRWRSDRPRGNRFGQVVAVGKGDRIFALICTKCEGVEMRMPGEVMVPLTEFAMRLESAKNWDCQSCGGPLTHIREADGRAPMHVKIGDTVVYPRVPANELVINGELLTMCHEEQHILAVVDQEAAA